MKRQFAAVVLSFCSLTLGSQALAQEDVEKELLDFCKRSPLNSKCEGVEAPVSLKERDGIEVECELRFGGNDKLEGCKYYVEEDTLTVYVEVGEKVEVLDDLQPTQEIKITPENLLFFPTVVNYRTTNKFGGGVIGNKLQYNQDIFFKVDGDEPSKSRSNRVSIYFKKSINGGQSEKEQELLDFIQTNQKFDTDKQKIAQEFADLQSPVENISQSQAIQKLIDEQSCVRCDLSGADLTGIELENANLEGANLSNAILTDAKLKEVYLLGANLENVVLNNAFLGSSELPHSLMTGASLQQTTIFATNLVGTNLTNADLTNAHFKYLTTLESANLSSTNLTEVIFEGINLDRANLTAANLENSTISVSSTIDGNLPLIRSSTLNNANLTNANLTNLTAEGTIFDNADLSDAILTGVNFSQSKVGRNKVSNYLREAKLINANLSNSQLDKADFSGANLTGASLTDANLDDARLCETILPDGSIAEEDCED
ncbi:MAG: pentapeptide repeat-containing protein [Cyanobacteria bacterium J06600_6]